MTLSYPSFAIGEEGWQREAPRLARLVDPLVAWYRRSARPLPFRLDATPYRVWISEIMLQQTRMEAAVPYFNRFTQELPDPAALAAAPEEQLMKLWEGLGYYSRARNLQKAARILVEEHGGQLPPSYDELLALPGIGEYTAGAIASIAFGIPVPAVDGNVLRVLSRILGCRDDILSPAVKKAFSRALLAVMPQDCPGDFNQALMELGATVCLPNAAPRCQDCPVADQCWALVSGELTALPVKGAKKPRRLQPVTVLIPAAQGKLLLHRRPAKGLLAGLWELPNREESLTREECLALLDQWGADSPRLLPLRPGQHIFSHITWQMTGYLALCREAFSPPPGFVWVTPDQLEADYALPSAFSCYRGELAAFAGMTR